MPFAIYALSLAAFAIGTAEFIIAGILPPVAADLSVTIPTAGLLVTAYAVGVAIGGPLLTIITARFSQRTVLIGVMVVFSIAQVLCALAPDYNLLLLARLLSSCGHGVFFGAGSVVVAQLVPVERRGKAFSLFVGGITIANLLGLPAGTAIAVQFGWRMSFLAVAAIGVIAALVIIWKLPRTVKTEAEHTTLSQQIKALRHQEVWLSYVTIALTMTGTICYSTFSVPLMLEVTGIGPDIIPWVLLLGGVGSVLGIWLGGELADWKPMPSLVAVLILQSLVFFLMIFTLHDPVLMTITVFASGIVGFAFSTPLQSRIVHAAREAPNFAASLISTAFNIGIAAGAFLGAMLLNAGVSYADLPAAPVVSALLGAGAASVSWWLERRAAKRAVIA